MQDRKHVLVGSETHKLVKVVASYRGVSVRDLTDAALWREIRKDVAKLFPADGSGVRHGV
jgi:hypothetical protein